MDAATNSKTCRTCEHTLPVSAFTRRRRGSDQRDSRCKDCRAAAMRAHRAVRRDQELAGFGRRLASASSDTQIRALTATMIEQFGGTNRLAQLWAAQIQAASENGPGGRDALGGIQAVVRLLIACES